MTVQDNLVQTFRQNLNDSELNLSRPYEFECGITTTVSFQKEDFILLDFKYKVEFADRTATDKVKKFVDF